MGRFFIIAIWVLLCLTVYAWTYTPQAAAMLNERTTHD